MDQLKIGVRAIAAFSDVQTEGQRTATALQRPLGGRMGQDQHGLVTRWLSGKHGKPTDPARAIEDLRKHLDKAAQSGKKLSDIKLPAFQEAAKHMDLLRQRLARPGAVISCVEPRRPVSTQRRRRLRCEGRRACDP